MNRCSFRSIRPLSQTSSLLVADSGGGNTCSCASAISWHSRETRRDSWGIRTRWLEWTEADRDAHRHPGGRSTTIRGPARGTRAHGRGAGTCRMGGPEPRPILIHWTAPYVFFTLKAPGITASIAFAAATASSMSSGFDVLLTDISEYTTSLRPSPHGAVIVLSDGNRGDRAAAVTSGLPVPPRAGRRS